MKFVLHKKNLSCLIAVFFCALFVVTTFPTTSFADFNEAGEAAAVVNTLNQQSGAPTSASVQAIAATATVPPTPSATSADQDCNLLNIGNCLLAALDNVTYVVASFAALLLGWVGSLFNWIVVLTIFQFGSYFGNSPGLLVSWGILRDIGNIALLFGFIFMGIMMILDLESFAAGKAIARLIIVAVLLNFSLFAAEAVIDVANVLSASIYTQAGSTGCNTSNVVACANQGIAVQIITATGLNSIFGGTAPVAQYTGNNHTQHIYTYIGIAIFMAVTMVVLLAACIMLIIRAVVLVIIMVLAPLGFAAMAIPPFANLGKQWRDMLISQAFFAPIYLLLLLISIQIMSAVAKAFSGGGTAPNLLAALSQPNTNFGTVFITFALMIGFMVAALMSAKKLGAVGANFATSIATKTVKGTMLAPVRAGRAVGGAVLKPVARQAVGGGAAFLGEKYDKAIARARESKNPWTRGLAKGARFVGLDEAIGNTTEGLKNAKLGNSRSFAEQKEFVKKRTNKLTETEELRKQTIDVKAGAPPKGDTEDQKAYDERKDKAEQALSKMSQENAEKIIKDTKNTTEREHLATLLKADKFEKAMENHDLGTEIHEQLAEGRYEKIDQSGTDFKKLKDAMRKLPERDKKLMARYRGDLFAKVLGVVSDETGESVLKKDEIEKMANDDAFTSAQRFQIEGLKKKNLIKKTFEESADPELDTRLEALIKNAGKEMGKVDTDILTNEGIAKYLTQQHIASMLAEGEIKKAEDWNKIIENLKKKKPAGAEWDAIDNYLATNATAKSIIGKRLKTK